MSTYGEEAARWAAVASRMSATLARDACEEGAIAFLGIEHAVTPKKTGALADSEMIDSLSGGGARAVAVCSPHKDYAEIRNDGGTITKKGRGSLGNPSVGWFGHSVTQHGTGYVQRAEAMARGAVDGACRMVLSAMLED